MSEVANAFYDLYKCQIAVYKTASIVKEQLQSLRDSPTDGTLSFSGSNMGPTTFGYVADYLETTNNIHKQLLLDGNGLCYMGIEYLARVLVGNKSILHVDLRNNNLADASVHPLLDALRHNHTIESILVTDNHISKDKAALLQEACEWNKIYQSIVSDDSANSDALRDCLKLKNEWFDGMGFRSL